MKASIIPPAALIRELAELSDYHLILCHNVLNSELYADSYRELSDRGDFIILDNSAHENRIGETARQLRRAADIIHPSEVVLPDKLFDGRTTVDLSEEAYLDLRTLYLPLMGVPQGHSFDEWKWCLGRLIPLVDTIGISKDFEIWSGGLTRLVETVEETARRDQKIHLLGWGRQLGWVQSIQGHDKIRGIDSAKPIVYAYYSTDLRNFDLSNEPPRYPSRPVNYFDLTPSDFDMELVCSNTRVFQNLVGVKPVHSIQTSQCSDVGGEVTLLS